MLVKNLYQTPIPVYVYVILLTFISSCGLLGSDDKEPLEPGPRNYEWTVDSVGGSPDMWVGWANSIWGSSPNDVWLAFTGGYENLWHYDGKEWSPFPYREGLDGFAGDFYSIYGFARDDVWMGGGAGDGGGIWHFDGSQWKEEYVYKKAGMSAATILDIWGESPTDIYAVGTIPTQSGEIYKGFILHYDGRRWQEVLMTDFGVRFQLVRMGKQGILIKAAGPYLEQLSGQMTIYKLSGGKLNEILSTTRSEVDHLLWLNRIAEDLFLLDGNNLKKYSGGNLLNLSEEISAETVYSFFGRHKKDVFLSASDGILHYNGEDTQLLIEDVMQPSVVLLDKDVFFFANDYEAGTNIIYHGTLTENQEEE